VIQLVERRARLRHRVCGKRREQEYGANVQANGDPPPSMPRHVDRERVDKPDSVEGRHPSMRPTRRLERVTLKHLPIWPCSGQGLSADAIAHTAGGLLHHRFTVACADSRGALHRRSVLCDTFPRSPPLRFPQWPALWSPDFPPVARSARNACNQRLPDPLSLCEGLSFECSW